MSPEISVIVPVYNAERYLRECLDSLSGQTFRNLEFLLTDDGSTDGSGAICDEYAAKDPRFVVAHQANAGAACARNLALDAARGEFLLFCDSDDLYKPEYCERMLALIREHDCDAVMCGSETFTEEGFCRSRLNTESLLNPGFEGFVERKDGEGLFGLNVLLWNKMFRRRIVAGNGIRFPAVRRHEDDAFCHQYAMCSERYYCTTDRLYRRRLRPGSVMDEYCRGSSSDKDDWLTVLGSVLDFARRNGIAEANRISLLGFAADCHSMISGSVPPDERTPVLERILSDVRFLFIPECRLESDGVKLWKCLRPAEFHDCVSFAAYSLKFALACVGRGKNKAKYRSGMLHYGARCREFLGIKDDG